MTKFRNSFITHLFIEMVYGRRGGLIYEQCMLNEVFDRLCESYGVFSGCREIAGALYRNVIRMLDNGSTDFTLPINGNKFIENIKVVYDESVTASYRPSVSRIEGKFNPLVIYVGGSYREYFDLMPMLMHELTHAYEDWNRLQNNADGLNSYADKVGYYKTIGADLSTLNDTGKKVRHILYYLNSCERNAYIAEICGALDSCGKTFNNVGEVYDFLEKSVIPFRNYQAVFVFAEEFIDETNEERQREIKQTFENLSNYKFKNYYNLAKWLTNRLSEYQRKFNRKISRLVREHVKMSEWYAPSQHEYIGNL